MSNLNFLHLLPLVILLIIGIVVGFVVSGESKLKFKNKNLKQITDQQVKKEPKKISLGLAFLFSVPLIILTLVFTIFHNNLAIISMWSAYVLLLFNSRLKYAATLPIIVFFLSILVTAEVQIDFVTKRTYPDYEIMEVIVSSSCRNSMSCILSDSDIAHAKIKNSNKDRKRIYFKKDSLGLWHIKEEEQLPYFNFVDGDYVLLKNLESFRKNSQDRQGFELPYGMHYYFESIDPLKINAFATKIAHDENKLILNPEDAERFFLSDESKDKNKDELDIRDFRYIILEIYKINDKEILLFNPENNQWEPKGENNFYPIINRYYNSLDHSKAEMFNDYLSFFSLNQGATKISLSQIEEILEQYKKDCIDYESFVEETVKRFENEPTFLQLDKIEDSVFKDQLILLKERGFLTSSFEEFEADRCYINEVPGDLAFSKYCLNEERVDLNYNELFSISSINGTIIIWDLENKIAFTDNPDKSISSNWNKVVVDFLDINFLNELINHNYPVEAFPTIEEHEYLKANLFELLKTMEDSNLKNILTSLKEQELLPLKETDFRIVDISCSIDNGVLNNDCLSSNWIEVKYKITDRDFSIYYHDDLIYIVNIPEEQIVVKVDDINDIFASVNDPSPKTFFQQSDLEELRKSGYGTFSRQAMENPGIVYLHNEYVYASNSD